MAEEMLTLEWLREGDVLYGDHNSRGVFRDAFGAQMGWQQGGAKIVSMPDDILLVTVSPHIYAIGKKEAALAHITRVERDGVQIFPPPECPFKKGDRVRRVRNGSSPASTEVVASVGWVSYAGRPYWQITTETYVAAPADDFELVPEPPAFKKGDWVEHEELGIGHVIDAYYENEVLVDFLGLRKRFYGTRVSCDLKPYEPPVERVCDIIRESLFNATRASQRIHDRYILIQKDTP